VTEPKILTIDIETKPHEVHAWGLFNQNIALNQLREPTRMMCWAAKWHGNPKVEYRSEFHHGREDMLERAWKLLDEADWVVHFNGDAFDLPHLRREFLLAKLGPPSPAVSIDLLKVARKQFRFASNKLQHLLEQLGIEGKVSHTGHLLWVQCMAGDPKAWRLMRKYVIGDVIKEELVYDTFLPWIPNHPHIGLFNPDASDGCARCGSQSLQKRGFSYTRQSSFQRFQCNNCHGWSTGTTAVARVKTKGIA
jgi:DNA polymerase elongation subunit (family B)